MRERKTNRLKEFNYSTSWYYFITICTYNMSSIFGDVFYESMILNDFGKVINLFGLKISELNKGIELDEHIIMPNHLHGIIIVGDEYISSQSEDRTKMTISKIIQQFKRACTLEIKLKYNFKGNLWQRSFYDRIIRDEKELYAIRNYIKENPLKWDIEKHITENLEL